MTRPFMEAADLVARSTYVHSVRGELPSRVFAPARSRLALVPLHLAVIATTTTMVALHIVPWFLFPIAALVIGLSFAGLTFVAHEAIHGGMGKGKLARHVAGWIGFLPFTVSPRLWSAWHDRVHHANANLPGDPDMYPTLAEYKASRAVRVVTDAFSLGGRRWRGMLSLVLGFSVQSAHQLVTARKRGLLTPSGHRWALAETFAGVAVWTTVAVLVGFPAFLVVFVAPLVVANIVVMAFILTNHSLCPRVEIDDPLVSSLSVTAPRWLERLTLMFGYHVEHHLFPGMSSRHAPAVRDVLRRRWPERYNSMPHLQALRALHNTARVYKDAVTLIDPKTGDEFPTLVPRATPLARAA